MYKIILWFLFLTLTFYSQINQFHSSENIKLFADYLFCQKDYLRSIEEFTRIKEFQNSDTLIFKIGYSYFQINDFKNAEIYFSKIQSDSSLKNLSLAYKALISFLDNDLLTLNNITKSIGSNHFGIRKLNLTSQLINENIIPSEEQITIFNDEEALFIKNIILRKNQPDHLSPSLAGLLSVIPGLGKVYTKNYTDGLTALLLTSLFTFLSYDNFKNNHQFRGYLFSVTALGFYLGNIFGSIVSAKKHNHQYDEKIFIDTHDFLKQKKYFIEDVKFCN